MAPLRNDEGGIEGYVSTAENVTGNIRAHLRYKRVLDTAIDGFWIVDPDGSLLEANDAYAANVGLQRRRIVEHEREPAGVDSGFDSW